MLWVPDLLPLDLKPRFVEVAPLPGAPRITIDRLTTGTGYANSLARSASRQGRMLWVDATANIERYDSDAKLAELIRNVKRSGFNTIVLDIKPISGQVIYRSRLAPRLTEWKGRRLDLGFDVLNATLRHAKPAGLSVLVSLNAFSEGHRMFNAGPGFQLPDRQTVIYEPDPILRVGDLAFPLHGARDAVAEGKLSVFSAADKLPASGSDRFAVTLRADRTIVDGFELAASPPRTPTIPRGGSLIFGQGIAGARLREQARAGILVSFETTPRYVSMAQWEGKQIPLMMNPNHPEVRKYALDILTEVVQNYPVDGVLYDDRLRYVGLNGDFSPITRSRFESKIGKQLLWPDDVFRYTLTPDLRRGLQPGPYYDQWLAWRAEVLAGYAAEARAVVKRLRPNAVFGAYVGSWYGEYSSLGHNYASVDSEAPFWYLSPNYRKAGTAEQFDLLVPGCYYRTATIADAMAAATDLGATVEASAAMANRLAQDRTWVYAGLSLSDFKEDPRGLQRAIQAAVSASQGVMVFDLSHDIAPMWSVFAEAFGPPKLAPHADRILSIELRKTKKPKRAWFPLVPGSAGTGQ